MENEPQDDDHDNTFFAFWLGKGGGDAESDFSCLLAWGVVLLIIAGMWVVAQFI